VKGFILLIVTSAFACLILSQGAEAEILTEADLSIWWVIHEEMENGIRQTGTGDEAAQEASGFNLNRARASLYYSVPERDLLGKLKLRMEDDVIVHDAWISYQPFRLFHIYIGQMKIPSTYEVMTEEHKLDFITRSTFSSVVSNYSLARTPYISPLQGFNSYNRDIGVGIKGSWKAGLERDVFKYFVMAGNGLGANNDIGGKEDIGFMSSNEFGEYFYGIRAELCPWEWISLGGHHNCNVHRDMLFKDELTVFDLDRSSWSADIQISLPLGFRAGGLYGEGVVDDDWFRDGKKNYEYSSWEAKLLKSFFNNKLEAGVRVDSYEHEYNESGDVIYEDHWTCGINYNPCPEVRLQLNYITKDTVQDYEEDLDDDIIFMNIQLFFQAGLI
jgi:hypothetical protein